MARIKPMPPEVVAHIRKTYEYDAQTGLIRHRRTGRLNLGWSSTSGYLEIVIRMGNKLVRLLYHRAVWLLATGCWPHMEIDHIDGDRRNNAIGNLRLVTSSENHRNAYYKAKANPDTGLPGVSPYGREYRASVSGRVVRAATPHCVFTLCSLMGKRYE